MTYWIFLVAYCRYSRHQELAGKSLASVAVQCFVGVRKGKDAVGCKMIKHCVWSIVEIGIGHSCSVGARNV